MVCEYHKEQKQRVISDELDDLASKRSGKGLMGMPPPIFQKRKSCYL